MAGFYDNLDAAIAKVGGEDEAYNQKLKTHFREALGYSNHIAKRDAERGKGLNLSNMKGNITPGGVKSLVGSAISNKNEMVGTYQEMANKTDIAAEGLAKAQAARERAAARAAKNKIGLENNVAFAPENVLEQKILEYMQNPKNADGSVKSLQQFESELNDYYESNKVTSGKYYDEQGNTLYNHEHRVHSPEDVKAAIQKRIPSDYIGNEEKYFLMSQGYSENQAAENVGALRYNEMSPAEKLIFETQSPGMAKMLGEGKKVDSAIRDASATQTVTGPGGEETTVPKYSFSELKSRNPSMSETELKDLVTPMYKNNASDDVGTYLNESDKKGDTNMEKLRVIYSGESSDYEDGGMVDVEKSPEYKEIKTQLQGYYGDVLTAQEIDAILFNNLMERIYQ